MDIESWNRERAAKLSAVDTALRMIKLSRDLEEAARLVSVVRDCYASAAYPMGLKKSRDTGEASPAKIRKLANAPWDDKSGY